MKTNMEKNVQQMSSDSLKIIKARKLKWASFRTEGYWYIVYSLILVFIFVCVPLLHFYMFGFWVESFS